MGGGRYWTEREVGGREAETEAETGAACSARFASPTIERGSMG